LQRGQYKNFEKLGLPPSDPVAKKDWADFCAVREKWLQVLANPDGSSTTEVSAPSPPAAPVSSTGSQR